MQPRFYPDSPPSETAVSSNDTDFIDSRQHRLYLAPEPEPLPLKEYADRASEADDLWFIRKGARMEYADSGFMWIRLMKNHPDLRNVKDPWEAKEIIEVAIGMPLSLYGRSENTYARMKGEAGSDLGELLLANWDEAAPALLAPCEGDFMEQANALRLAQPVCSDRCQDGSDPYHALLGLCYWLSVLKGGEPFDLHQERAARLIDRTKMTVNNLLKIAVKEGYLARDTENGPQDFQEAYRTRKCYRWRWLTSLSTLGVPKETLPTETYRVFPSPTRSTWEEEEEKTYISNGRFLAYAKGRSKKLTPLGSNRRFNCLEEFLGRLEQVTGGPTQYSAQCPCHKGSRQNLRIRLGDDGRKIILHCHRGCETRDVVEAMGLQMRDLFLS